MSIELSIKDVAYLGIHNTAGKVFYSMNFDKIDIKDLLNNIGRDEIGVYNNYTMMVDTRHTSESSDIQIVLLSKATSNELFVRNAMDNLIMALEKYIKKWSFNRIELKYDLIVLVCNEFLYNGIILEDDYKKLLNRIEKRTFESLAGIKVNKGLASMLGKAARDVKDSFNI
ncbi:COPZ [Hepatospora eriocheir]|uniref:COPZ n=1 Tax=Hepatospora eriocheir TaxID=1081669 RepID=A0A1X0QG89_9MICR|nr:COPZ [Hepatospora eriocheir]